MWVQRETFKAGMGHFSQVLNNYTSLLMLVMSEHLFRCAHSMYSLSNLMDDCDLLLKGLSGVVILHSQFFKFTKISCHFML